VIAKGEPLVSFLAEAYGLSESAIRRWRGVTLQRCGRMDAPRAVVGFIGALPQHLRPRSRADFTAARRLAATMINPVEHTPLPVDQVRVLTSGMKHPLAHYLPRIDELAAGLNDVRHSLDGICIHKFGEPHPRDALLSEMSFGRLLELNQRWHIAHQAATKEAANRFGDAASIGWPGIIPGGSMTAGDLLAIELTTPAALLQEGRELGHCVGSYHEWCYSGESRIVALRSADSGAHRSTIELKMQHRAGTNKRRLVIAQHYGQGNRLPPKEDVAVAKVLLKMLRRICGDKAWPSVDSPESLAFDCNAFIRERMRDFVREEFPQVPKRCTCCGGLGRTKVERTCTRCGGTGHEPALIDA